MNLNEFVVLRQAVEDKERRNKALLSDRLLVQRAIDAGLCPVCKTDMPVTDSVETSGELIYTCPTCRKDYYGSMP
jgi:transposase-like protein